MAFFSEVCITLDLYLIQYLNYLLLVLFNSFWGILNFQGDLVWLRLQKVNDFDVPIGATVKSVDALGMLLTDDEGQVCTMFSLEKEWLLEIRKQIELKFELFIEPITTS